MSSQAPFVLAWWRRNFAWRNTREAWTERLCAAALLAGAGGLWAGHAWLSAAQEMVLWGVVLVSAAQFHRWGWLRLVGPIFLFELIRAARKAHLSFHRFLYGSLILALLFSIYVIAFGDRFDNLWERYFTGQAIPPKEVANFAAGFFFSFVVLQFLALFAVTPPYMAGAVAEEKTRRTLEFLLATDLRAREIILGKFAARLVNLTFFLATSLPILAMMQFLGGIDPGLLIAIFIAAWLTLLSLGSVSLLISVYARRPAIAIGRTYVVLLAYLFLPGAGQLLLSVPFFAGLSLSVGSHPILLHDVVNALTAGNAFSVVMNATMQMGTGGSLGQVLPSMLRDYAFFHAIVAAICCGWAVARLRAVARKQAEDPLPKSQRRGQRGRPAVSNYPVLWKETYAESLRQRTRMSKLVAAGVVFLIASITAGFLLWVFYLLNLRAPMTLAEGANFWVRTLGTLGICAMLVQVLQRAAASISSERERQTLDTLLTTPLKADGILFSKGLGSIMSARRLCILPVLVWAIGMAMGGLHGLAVLLLLAAWWIYAVFVANLGMWCSLASRTSLRATIATTLTVFFVGFGHWIMHPLVWYSPRWEKRIQDFQAFGLTPPVTLGFLASRSDQWRELWNTAEGRQRFFCALAGLGCYALAAVLLWVMCSIRFRRVSNRGWRSQSHASSPPALRDGQAGGTRLAANADRAGAARGI